MLYKTTLDENNQGSHYQRGTVLFLLLFVLAYCFFLASVPGGQARTTDIFKLLCGIYNGLAMGLLFGRITSMEYHFKDMGAYPNKFIRKAYQYGVTFILTLYGLAQPLYGAFAFQNFASANDIFKSLVFIVCFVGKAFLLIFISNSINNLWLHAYLHVSLANHKRSLSILGMISKN